MMNPPEHICENCAHVGENEHGYSVCRRYAPREMDAKRENAAVFPVVGVEDTCGEFRLGIQFFRRQTDHE